MRPLMLFCSASALVGIAVGIPQSWYPKELTSINNHADEMMQLANSVNSTTNLEKRVEGGVFICTDDNWEGTCGFAKQPWNECIQLTSPYFHTISAIGPDPFNMITAHTDFNCASSTQLNIFYPGFSALGAQLPSWNDAIGSFVVQQIPGSNCVESLSGTLGCGNCCNGCQRSGQDCCPEGMTC